MPGQIVYYNRFGELYKEEILACPEPHLWTTDYKEKGRVYREMEERIAQQESIINQYFTTDFPVLDIGCGFGRQAFLLAKKNFTVVGTDTSAVFIEIAKELFARHHLTGEFYCTDIIHEAWNKAFAQILLLDVLEHIAPGRRKTFLQKIYNVTAPGGLMILSLPHIKERWRSQLNNNMRKRVTQHFAFFRNMEEHPYPVPQKRDILQLTAALFSVVHFNQTPVTDYYVLQKHENS